MVTITIRQLIIGALLLTALVVFVRRQPEPAPHPQSEPIKHQSAPVKLQPARAADVKAPVKNPVQQQPAAFENQPFVEDSGDPALKQAYYCNRALLLRERCERIPRDEKSLEFCLKATGYYMNTRYCGYQP